MPKEKPVVEGQYVLQKFPGKGGWTYAPIPEVAQNKKNPFGWVTVRGSIDDHKLRHYKLMPMGNGKLFLPVKSEIRKKINKQAGDKVMITLYLDQSPLEIPEEILDCFKIEPAHIYQTFLRFSTSEQKSYLDWIYKAKNPETKTKRIVGMMNRLQKKLRLNDKG